MVIISTGIALTLASGLLTLLFLARGDLPYAIGAGVAALTTLLIHILDYYYAIAIISTGIVLVYSTIVLFSHNPRSPHESELHFITTNTETSRDSTTYPLPKRGITTQIEEIELSVVIPCYNETKRLKIMLEDAISYLRTTYDTKFEILIVDDGSKDGTAEYALDLAFNYFELYPGQLRVVKLVKNRGKGGAVTHGIQHVRGKYAVFADADGASQFSDVSKLIKAAESIKGPAVAVGSRAHMVNSDAVVKRSFIRNFLMYSLHTLVFVFGIRDIKDTQCGFKLFNKEAIVEIFPYMHTEGWIFDVEILIIALRKQIPIKEVAISWHEVDGSKVDLAKDSINMAIDLVVTRLAYIFGIYKDN
ncbi:glycosyltransferase family 2 protein [Wickerhamomyces anomalus NRRL Y-366-8]|uniref:dolichyl-phosphate beta-glucosyltransferase n=1 Tax=Wickerhamomyces anomalus (strain ATCC 58044 / CBS 1984 / NCYC 433 / NRRL Y-366-8) TaxID=683960 RepID=A0A1E3P015_WICAA|nr:glycosyltransferase family 2 protein [Wickerhamomyces anomalus NRRL Y-366-8]ODQ58282.1 glycosyltransferase family 2 protein [Wickerhamomyces anomalus NRRL Y-366-8]